MSEKIFINESIGVEEAYCDFSIIKVGDKIISDRIPTTDAIGICGLLNEQQATINLLLDLLYQSEATVINEYSSHIGEDMDKLDKIFKEKDIKEIERFVRGCDDE